MLFEIDPRVFVFNQSTNVKKKQSGHRTIRPLTFSRSDDDCGTPVGLLDVIHVRFACGKETELGHHGGSIPITVTVDRSDTITHVTTFLKSLVALPRLFHQRGAFAFLSASLHHNHLSIYVKNLFTAETKKSSRVRKNQWGVRSNMSAAPSGRLWESFCSSEYQYTGA